MTEQLSKTKKNMLIIIDQYKGKVNLAASHGKMLEDKFGPLVVDVSDVARLLPQCQLNGEKETKFRYESKKLKVREALNQ